MAIRVRDGGRDFIPAPAGLQQAVCCDIIELGIVVGKFGPKRKVEIRWQSENLMEGGKPFLLRNQYTASLNEKATLRQHLESWIGKPLTDEEAGDFDLEDMLGRNCQLLVVHNINEGRTYANVKSVVPVGKSAAFLKVTDYIRVQDREGYEPPQQVEPSDEPKADADDDITF